MRSAWLACGLLLMVAPSTARANGAYTHVHISQLAYEALPAGPLRELLADPEALRALEAGSMFPDSGYAVGDGYGEIAHWGRFLNAYLAFVRSTWSGDYTSAEARQHVAFLLGVASHGMADQSYDTTLLERAFEVDGPEESTAPVDQLADYFLVIDHEIVFTVEAWAPYDDLVSLLGDVGHGVDATVLLNGMNRMESVTALQSDPRVAGRNYWTAWEHYPFLGTHVYSERAVGSAPWLAGLVADYWAALWRQLTGAGDVDADYVIRTAPESGDVSWPIDRAEHGAYGRIAIWFGYAVDRDLVTPRITLRDASGAEVPVSFATAYGGRERNLIFVEPDAPLAYDTEHTVQIAAGAETLSGEITGAPFAFSFRTRCADDRLDDCPPLDPPLETGPVPMRPPVTPRDAGTADGGVTEAAGGCAVRPGAAAAGPVVTLGLVLLLFRRRTRAS